MKKNILVFPCGSEIALEVYQALKNQKDISLIGASSVNDHGRFVFENYIGDVPFITDENFIPKIQQIISGFKIDVIYPCLDVVITKLINHKDELNCKIIGSDIETVNICQRKSLTYRHLKGHIRVPNVFQDADITTSTALPIFSKPDIGSSSRDILKIETPEDLFYSRNKYPKNLLLEYLPGHEYTVDCFTKKSGEIIFISPRKRNRISNGISVNIQLVQDKAINKIAHKINKALRFNGAWFFQIKKDIHNKYCLMEVASRFGGSSLIQRYLGVNLPYLNVLNEYHDVSIIQNTFAIEVDRSFDAKSRSDLHYNYVYLDFDDTLIINDKINTDVIKFIYQCINNKIKVILLTKHLHNINHTLKRMCINPAIFYRIVNLKKEQCKYEFIKHTDAIFIDDSFAERKSVSTLLNIPVFDVDGVEFLLNMKSCNV